MKKLFILIALAATTALSSFAAEGSKINYAIRNSFEKQFKNASDVNWTSGTNYTKAVFVLNNVRTEAFYSTDGNLIGTSQSVNMEELPGRVKRIFEKKYARYTVKEAIRFEGTEESAYYFSVENEKEAVILKASDSGFVSVVER